MEGSEMAANQVSNQKNKPTNSRNQGGQQGGQQHGGQQHGGQQQGSQTGRQAGHEESSSSYGAIGDMAEQASDYVTQGAEQVQECIREHSGASVMISLVAGFGIGLLIGRAIGTPDREPRSRRYRATAERFGTRLMDRIEAMIPDAVAEHFGS
jgi:hypothetical protein